MGVDIGKFGCFWVVVGGVDIVIKMGVGCN